MNTVFRQPLRKRHQVRLCDYRVVTVDAYALRESQPEAEEFTLFGTRAEFPGVVPGGDIWISRRHFPREGVFLLSHALARLGATGRGLSEEEADQAGLDAERHVREDLTGEEYRDGKPHRVVPEKIYDRLFATIPDPERPIKAWVIDGYFARCWYKTDYAEGGHYEVYPWVPAGEIWLEKDTDPREMVFILAHEYLELRMMRDSGLSYDHAHEIASKIEFEFRRGESGFPIATGRRLRKSDIPSLADPKVYDYLREHYLSR